MLYETNGYIYDVIGPEIRRERILGLLKKAKLPINRKELSETLGITLGTLQHDIDILKAKGNKIYLIHGNYVNRPTGYYLERRKPQ